MDGRGNLTKSHRCAKTAGQWGIL